MSLHGISVLVPRGGKWGDSVAAGVRASGGKPVIAPLINFAAPEDTDRLSQSLARLEEGVYDWLVVTSSTTVDVLLSQQVRVPPTTRIAAVGETTAGSLGFAGYVVDFVPDDNSARGLVKEWPVSDIRGRVLIPQAEIAEPTLVRGLSELGFDVEFVTSYRTVGVPAAPEVVERVASGEIGALLVTSGSIARQVSEQFAPLPESTIVVCIGPRTAFDARAAGLTVHAIAEERSADSMIQALGEHLAG